MNKVAMALTTVVMLTACEWGDVTERVTQIVPKWCERSPTLRQAARDAVNAELKSESMAVRVWCPGDDGNPAE